MVGHKDVRWLDVAMNNSPRVRNLQGIDYLAPNLGHLLRLDAP